MNSRTFKAADAQRLEDPERQEWLPLQEAIEALGISPGMTIADIGAGTGYFAIPFARAVESSGTVLAIDFQPDMLAIIRQKLKAPAAPQNIRLLEGSAENTGVPESRCNLVFLANIWHELDDHVAVLREAARILTADGSIAVLDWRHDVTRPPGPRVEHRVSLAKTRTALEDAGCHIRHAGSFGAYNYLVIGSRPAR
ncbi:MAG: methyltransferase domain-containing protein [Candidatus Solibacter sp.]